MSECVCVCVCVGRGGGACVCACMCVKSNYFLPPLPHTHTFSIILTHMTRLPFLPPSPLPPFPLEPDECARLGCNQSCIVYNGNATCLCRAGYSLSQDGRTCEGTLCKDYITTSQWCKPKMMIVELLSLTYMQHQNFIRLNNSTIID